ncbi:MAG: glycerate kinase [Oscillospiraceae bacterium]|nr:glycerate kinase [Oscillospiraceae bacterium]
MKKIVFAPDSFKGTMSSIEVCDIMDKAFRTIKPDVETVKIPIADGGEGTVDAFLYAVGGEKVFVKVKNPLFEDIDSFYCILKDRKTAVIEMAAASGLPLIEDRKNPLDASTFGTGLLIKDALDKGCTKIILGLGGSATNDGGIGIATALGVKFLDVNMRDIMPSNRGLRNLKYIDDTGLDNRLKSAEFVVACDVDNILCGQNGASYIFGPQKGADKNTVKILDENLSRYADILFEHTDKEVRNIPGTGAAGGVLASLLSFPDFINCKICPGIDIILDTAGFDEIIKDADLIITGEGKFDSQSLRGKAVSGIAKRAKKQNKPVIVIAGDTREYGDEIYDLGIQAVFSACSGVYTSFGEIKQTCFEDLRRTAENIARIIDL